MIQTPEGAAFYFSDAADQTAVRLMAEVEDYPPDLSFAELESMESARLAAERVKVDLWRLLRSVWRATWGSALISLPQAEPLTLGEHEDLLGDGDDYSPTVDTAWEDRWSGWGYRMPDGGVLLTGVRRDETGRLNLIVYAADAKGSTDERLDETGAAWERDDEEWLVFKGAGIKVGDGALDATDMERAAAEVCGLISSYL